MSDTAVARRLDLAGMLPAQVKQSEIIMVTPTATYGTQLGPYDQVTLEIIPLAVDDYYPVGGGKVAFLGHLLDKIAAAAGIAWMPYPYSKLEWSADKRMVTAHAMGVLQMPMGGSRPVSDAKVIDLDAKQEELELTDKTPQEVRYELVQFRKFMAERAMSGAKNRVIRQLIAIRGAYPQAALAAVKYIGFPRVSLDVAAAAADPAMAHIVSQRYQQASQALGFATGMDVTTAAGTEIPVQAKPMVAAALPTEVPIESPFKQDPLEDLKMACHQRVGTINDVGLREALTDAIHTKEDVESAQRLLDSINKMVEAGVQA
jgi:hypothetical protein